MKHIAVLFIIICASGNLLIAQTTYIRPSAIGLSFMLNDFPTAQRINSSSLGKVLKEGNWSNPKEMAPGLSISYFKGLHRNIDLAGNLGLSFLRYPFLNRPASPDNSALLELEATANIKMLSEKYLVTPYLIAGLGGSKYQSYYGAYIPAGVGLKVNFFDEAALFLNTTYKVVLSQENTTAYFNYSLGIAGAIGKKKAPKKTLPNLTPRSDRDNDGIPDASDACPDLPGLARYRGCPIPDTDKDGISDEEDKCPKLVGVTKYQGCPVPDKDGDGVNDEEDSCPDASGTASNGGCPEIHQELISRLNRAARQIFFATASAILLDSSHTALDEVVKILASEPYMKLSIEGHTDDVGNDEANMTLSENRAKTVKAYLVSHGIDESRIQVQGYGETRPIADNSRATGQATNRRVELKLKY